MLSMEREGLSLRRDGMQGKECALSLLLDAFFLLDAFSDHFFHNFCCFNALENAALKACFV